MQLKNLFAALAIGSLAALALHQMPSRAQEAWVAKPVSVPEFPQPASVFVMQPTISPDGNTVIFCHDGDLWSIPAAGGTARRLTVTADNDLNPVISPDGKQVVFRSQRYGDYDLFVMPIEGGPATRLTFHGATDIPCCWLPDGSGVIFQSVRRNGAYDLWVQRLDGSEPWPITDGGYRESEFGASISMDGKTIVYSRRGGSAQYQRRGYSGTSQNDLWACDFDGVQTSNHRPLVDTDAVDTFANIVGERVDYVTLADEKGAARRSTRLASVNLATGNAMPAPAVVDDLRDLSYNGNVAVFTTGAYQGFRLGVLKDGKVSWPSVAVASDVRRAEDESFTNRAASEFSISPDGKVIAFVAGHDLYVQPAEDGAVPKLVHESLGRERCIAWHPKEYRLVVAVEDENFVQNLWHFDLAAGTSKQLTNVETSATCPQYSPDGREILYVEAERAIKAVDESGAALEVNIEGSFFGATRLFNSAFSQSPQGRYLAFYNLNSLGKTDIVIADRKDGQVHRVTRLFGDSRDPVFSADGKYLAFVSSEAGDYDLYRINLIGEEPEFAEDKLEKVIQAKSKKPAASGDKADATKPAEKLEEPKDSQPEPDSGPKPREWKDAEINFTDIHQRVQRITTLSGHESSPVLDKDGRSGWFISSSGGSPQIWSFEIGETGPVKTSEITKGGAPKSGIALSGDGKMLWTSMTGVPSVVSVKGGTPKSYGFSITQRRNRLELRRIVMREVAWTISNFFYDKDIHGLPWSTIAQQYLKATDSVSTGDEFGVLVNEMLGELNSSHQGYTTRDVRSDSYAETIGELGLDFDPVSLSQGVYRITEVLKGGAADLKDNPVKAGQYLVGIDDQLFKDVSGPVRLSRLLLDKAGRKTTLHLSMNADGSDATAVHVKPGTVADLAKLYYETWVEKQRAMVHRLSQGRLGYVHIQAMNDPSLRHFKHHLGDDMEDKEGVVIDVRFNGGGNTAVHVLEILMKKTWLIRTNRALDGEVSENIYRSTALEKPSCLMINGSSFSNAEIMAEGFRRLGIGPIIGVPTAGGVIGTSSLTLIDGSRMRLPMSGAYAVDGENLENNGRKPDILVDNTPQDAATGRDRQTEAAVSALLEKLAESKK